jgi:ubiquinone/menaquinone biosynthesis C-methylase UbiE
LTDCHADVDASVRSATDVIEWQERVDAWPQVRAYKQRSYELCASAMPRLDVGAGPGTDAEALAAIACDPSIVMCEVAATRGVPAVRADIHALPLPSTRIGAVRTDRVLHHVAEPSRAIRELVRVCAPGGRVVICEADQESLVIHLSGVSEELVAKVKAMRRDRGYRNGTLARRVPAMLSEQGLEDVTVEAFPLVLTDPADAFGLPGWPRYWRAHFSTAEIDEWERAIREHREGGFVYALLYFVIAGTRQ